MIPTERRQIILDMVAEKGVVSIAELTERMHVSHMTIRRDLQKLEQQGAVIGLWRRAIIDSRGARTLASDQNRTGDAAESGDWQIGRQPGTARKLYLP